MGNYRLNNICYLFYMDTYSLLEKSLLFSKIFNDFLLEQLASTSTSQTIRLMMMPKLSQIRVIYI